MEIRIILITTALMLASPLAFAGYAQPQPVLVTVNADGSVSASGDMLTARTSKAKIPDPVTGKNYEPELIGCVAYNLGPSVSGTGAVYSYGFCQATNTEGVQAICFTEDADLLDVLKIVSDRSYLSFHWDADGNCTYIRASTQSFYLDKDLHGNKVPD